MARKRKQYGDGGIYPDKQTGGYLVKLPDGHGKYIQRRVNDRATAKALYKTLLAKRDAGMNFDGAKQTLDTFTTTWYNEVALARAITPKTQAHYESTIRLYIVPYHGAMRLDSIRPEHVQTLLNKLRTLVGVQTVAHVYNIYKQIMHTAEKWQYITRNPVALVERPKVEPYVAVILTTQQLERLFSVIQGHRLEGFYYCGALLGLRRGEAAGLRWSDYNADERTIAITQQVQYQPGQGVVIALRTKTHTSRRVLPVPAILADLFSQQWERLQEERKHSAWKEHGLLFPTAHGTPLSPNNINLQYKRVFKKAGLPETTRFHDLRHTCATRLGEFTPEHIIGAILGHSSGANITRHYAKATMHGMREAIEELAKRYHKAA